MTFIITEEERQIVIYSLRDRISRLYRDSWAYRDNGNTEAQMDCIKEIKKVQLLLDYIESNTARIL